jgi:hypothetical protein
VNLFLIKISLFGLLLVSISIGINYFQNHYNQEPEHYKLQFQEVISKKENANAIIIGTSHSTHSVRPSYLNNTRYKFYNFSLNGSNPSYYLNWYNDFFSKLYDKPEYCIISIDWFMFKKEWLWRDFEQDSEYIPNNLFYKLLADKNYNLNKLIMNRFPFLKYRDKISESLRFIKGDNLFLINDYDDGFIPYETAHDTIQKLKIKDFNAEVDSEKEKRNFIKLISKLKQDSIKLIFIMTPEYGIEPKLYKDSKALDYIKKLSIKYNIPFINYNTTSREKEINNNLNYFTDWGHMNKEGSRKFSKTLADDIDEVITNLEK